MSKPRIAELLGVKVGERFTFKGFPNIGTFQIEEDGSFKPGEVPVVWADVVKAIVAAIDDRSIVVSLKWTEKDIADAKAVKQLCGNRIVYRDCFLTKVYIETGIDDEHDCRLQADCFPSLEMQEKEYVDRIIEAEEYLEYYGYDT